MTTIQILWAFVGLILCSAIMATVGLLIAALVWHMIRNDLDFDDIANMEDLEDEER